MTDDSALVHQFEPYADHFFFVISDAEATDGMLGADTWGNANEASRIAKERHCIVVGTARYDYVPVTVALRDAHPAAAPLDAYDHVVEADIVLPSGSMAVTGATEPTDEVKPVPLAAGRYRVRVAYARTDHRPANYNPEEPGEHFEYQLTVWPTDAPSDVQVFKQGPSPWAY